jgi:hypothetical protein
LALAVKPKSDGDPPLLDIRDHSQCLALAIANSDQVTAVH